MSAAQQITQAYGGDWHGSYGSIPTPGHSKGDRGTTVKDEPGAPDGLLVNSHNGGDALAIKDEFRAKGLLPQREMTRSNANKGSEWRCTGTYEYDDGAGNIVYRTRRLEKTGEKKRFVAERLECGRWVNGLGDLSRVPYRFTEIRSALSKAALTDAPFPPVYLVEGERKADKLAAMGFLATAIAFGAKGWKDAYGDALSDAPVIILPDNDEPGRKFAEIAKTGIESYKGTAHIVELPGLPAKGDIMDWRGSADDLRALTAQGMAGKPGQLLPLINPADWQDQQAPSREWLLKDWIPARQMTYLTGAGASGKSLLAQQLCTCVAIGRPLLGIEAHQAVALYITCEDDGDELHRRQAAICEALGVSLRDLGGRLHLVSLAGALNNELATFDAEGRLQPSNAWRVLRRTVEAIGAGFIVLDNTAHLFAGNENVRNEVAAFTNLLNSLAAETGAAVLLLGHPNKAGDAYSGSTAWENQVRSRLFLERPTAEDGSILDLDARQISKGKANYTRSGDTHAFRWHNWAFVREDDLPADARTQLSETIAANGENATFLRCLAQRTKEKRQVSEKVGANYAPKIFAGMPESKGIKRHQLVAAMDRLFRIGKIERGLLWRDTAEGKDIFGLREISGNVTGNVPENHSGNDRKPAENDRKIHPLYTSYIPDAAPTGSPASDEEDLDWGTVDDDPDHS